MYGLASSYLHENDAIPGSGYFVGLPSECVYVSVLALLLAVMATQVVVVMPILSSCCCCAGLC